MSRFTLSIIALLSFLFSFAQTVDTGNPVSWKLFSDQKTVPFYTLPGIDLEEIRQEDSINDLLPKPWRFGIKHEVEYGFENGQWNTLANGDRLWRIRIESPGALSLNVIFDEFDIPEGSTVHLYDNKHTQLIGAYTHVQNQESGVLGTWIIESDVILIEYYEPLIVAGQGHLHIGSVTHGYRNAKQFKQLKALNSSGDCNLDVDCSIGADWDDLKDINKKSVGILIEGGSSFCSGALVNNTANDETPYFLTANHCYSNPSTWSFRFEWISPNAVCATTASSSNGPTTKTISGATLRARNANSDFCLLEINQPIPSTWDLTWAGWDKSDNFPTFSVGIHHPSGDVMKVCRDNDAPTKNVNSNAQTWEISASNGGWDIGVTEPGSSGSPLFDQDGRIIGQLYGGGAACSGTVDNDLKDYYGRFGVSWDGANSSERLKDWLDPINSNVDTLSMYPPLIVYSLDAANSISFPEESCGGTYASPSITLKNRGTTPLTTAKITWSLNNGLDSVINWTGNLLQNETESISLGTLYSSNGVFEINSYVSDPNGGIDEYHNNDTTSNTVVLNTYSYETTQVHFELLTDDYSQETSWEFRTMSGTVLHSGGPYFSDNTTFQNSFNVTPGECYVFEIFDDEGDGICCNYGNGSYKLTTDNNIIIHQGGNFNSSESTEITVSIETSTTESKQEQIKIFPNPAKDMLTISSENGNRYDYRILNALAQQLLGGNVQGSLTINISSLPKGIYFVELTQESGKRLIQKLIIE